MEELGFTESGLGIRAAVRFLYGVNPVLEALRADPGDIKRVLIERGRDGRRSAGGDKVAEAARALNVRVEDAAHGELTRRTQGGVHQGVGCELADFAYVELPDLSRRPRGRGARRSSWSSTA